MLLGREKYNELDIRVRVKGGGHVSQAYAIRQSLAKALVSFYQKCAPLLALLTRGADLIRTLVLVSCVFAGIKMR